MLGHDGFKAGTAVPAWAIYSISSLLLLIFPCSYRKENKAHLITAKLTVCRDPKDYQQQNIFMSLIRTKIYCSLNMFSSLLSVLMSLNVPGVGYRILPAVSRILR